MQVPPTMEESLGLFPEVLLIMLEFASHQSMIPRLMMLAMLVLPFIPAFPVSRRWETFGGHYYYFSASDANLTSARDACTAAGGYLACVGSAEENNFIYQHLNGHNAWIGYTDEVVEGQWHWMNGEPNSYTNWNSGEPNNGLGGGAENYAVMMYSWSGSWNDAPGGMSMSYVLEIEPVRCLYPNGSESFVASTNETIRWQNTLMTGNVRIDLNSNYPSGSWNEVATVAVTTGSYSWTVPSLNTTTGRLRIVSVSDSTIYDLSDLNFTIVSAPPTNPTNLTISRSGNNTVLNWTAASGLVTGYKIYRDTTGYFTITPARLLATTTTPSITTYLDAGVSNKYFYRVTAYNNGSSSSSAADGILENQLLNSPVHLDDTMLQQPSIGVDHSQNVTVKPTIKPGEIVK